MSQDKEISLHSEVEVKDLFEFMMDFNYKCLRGVLTVLFSIACIVGVIIFWGKLSGVQRGVIIFIPILFLVISPMEYYLRDKRQKKKSFSQATDYVMNEEGITIKVGEEEGKLQWSDIVRVKTTKNLLLIYTSPVMSFIIPKRQIEDKFDTLKNILENNTKCYYFKMKK